MARMPPHHARPPDDSSHIAAATLAEMTDPSTPTSDFEAVYRGPGPAEGYTAWTVQARRR